jgi:adenine nucleotide transporter 17
MQLRQSADPNKQYKSVIDGFRKIVHGEGVKGLYKGIETKLLQSVLTSAFLFMGMYVKLDAIFISNHFTGKEAFFAYAVRILISLGARQQKV